MTNQIHCGHDAFRHSKSKVCIILCKTSWTGVRIPSLTAENGRHRHALLASCNSKGFFYQMLRSSRPLQCPSNEVLSSPTICTSSKSRCMQRNCCMYVTSTWILLSLQHYVIWQNGCRRWRDAYWYPCSWACTLDQRYSGQLTIRFKDVATMTRRVMSEHQGTCNWYMASQNTVVCFW